VRFGYGVYREKMGVKREYVERLKKIGGKGRGIAVKNLDHDP